MKLVVLALILSGQAMAQTCFTRTVELETNEVTLAREICFEAINLDLDYFGGSKAKVKLTADGIAAEKEFSLNAGRVRADGSRLYEVVVSGQSEGGFCDDFWQTEATASIVISKDAKTVAVENVKGELFYSWDQCHSDTDLKQSFDYAKN